MVAYFSGKDRRGQKVSVQHSRVTQENLRQTALANRCRIRWAATVGVAAAVLVALQLTKLGCEKVHKRLAYNKPKIVFHEVDCKTSLKDVSAAGEEVGDRGSVIASRPFG